MQTGRCRAAGLCGAILTIWWAAGPSPPRAQTTVGSTDVYLPIQNAAGAWVIASFARAAGNVWSNPELTCQHVDPQPSLSPGQRAIIELKLLVIRGSLDDALERAIRQRESLK